jgi:plasmid stabilization system protein ParE
MTRRVIIRREARRDLREAQKWYRNISRELANDFIRRIDEAIVLAQERPLAFQFAHRTFRRILVHRFPYALFYQVDETRIVVVAVLHQARDPETLGSRQV